MTIVFGANQGVFNSISALVGEVLSRYGYDSNSAGVFGALVIVMGLIGAMLFGLYVDKTKKFKSSLIICTILGSIGIIAMFLVLEFYNNYYLCAFTACFWGFFLMPMIPLCYDLGCEIAFPVGEAMA